MFSRETAEMIADYGSFLASSLLPPSRSLLVCVSFLVSLFGTFLRNSDLTDYQFPSQIVSHFLRSVPPCGPDCQTVFARYDSISLCSTNGSTHRINRKDKVIFELLPSSSLSLF